MNLKQKINLTRIGNILIYFSQNTYNCGITKAFKLLYYLDCEHLYKYGRTVTENIFKKLPQGPVPTELYSRLQSIIELNNKNNDFNIDENFKEFLMEFIDIEKRNQYNYEHYNIIPKKQFEKKWFSKSERIILKKISEKYKNTTAKELSNKTHNELPYRKAENSGKIDLKLFVKNKISKDKYKEIEYIEKMSKAMELNYK